VQDLRGFIAMRKEYDFTKSKKSPYPKALKQQVTMLVDKEAVAYFKELAEETSIPYQLLINMFLRDGAESHKRPSLKWVKASPKKRRA
jgi:predicted DNA binding CopG/RHH family protein